MRIIGLFDRDCVIGSFRESRSRQTQDHDHSQDQSQEFVHLFHIVLPFVFCLAAAPGMGWDALGFGRLRPLPRTVRIARRRLPPMGGAGEGAQ